MPSAGRAAFVLVAVTVAVAVCAVTLRPSMAARAPRPDAPPRPVEQARVNVPVMAYYFISHTNESWWQHKRDIPALGRYTSDSPEAIREHIRMARDAGVRAFIVHWHSNEVLNHALDLLVQEARSQNFKLAIHYAALDENRRPVSIAQVAADLDFFAERWARDPVFDVFGQPLVIIDGTWEYSLDDLTILSGQHRLAHPRDPSDPGQPLGMLLLGSERDADGYARVASVLDGNAYYWSSADPSRREAHVARLLSLREAVGKGMWIAPAAPGFDASLLGATRVIDRFEGRTFIEAIDTALESRPDALGIISWNEFDENTQIEPSGKLGTRALEVLADYTSGHAPATVQRLEAFATTPDEPPPALSAGPAWLSVIVGLVAMLAVVVVTGVAVVRGVNARRPVETPF
ncbi:MAG: hypothetical protein IT299_07505 [Dehalococcoidia bacterium]|nr:hypothetical protein [Dehalococcoidia bacterium]